MSDEADRRVVALTPDSGRHIYASNVTWSHTPNLVRVGTLRPTTR